jgi:adsorption protein B
MMSCIVLPHWLLRIDAFVGACIAPLAIAILISGLDDMVVDLVWLWARLRDRRSKPAVQESEPKTSQEKRIAIFVPLWHEHVVIERMLDHNLAAIHYQNYDFFAGGYPNDDRTLEAVRQVEARSPRVHLAVCPHSGPTSKADCLNWIYQRMLLHEEQYGVQFDVVVTHDAEDMIHPESLRVMNREMDSFDMVQVPVLPLRTPALEMVHGVYCDEFAEFQMRDMPVRRVMGSFTPSSGVGTAYSRAGLERLAASAHNCVFDPLCLTEDYENGMRLHMLGCPQVFVPLQAGADRTIATREFFPRKLHAAIRQRTRWVTGIALQTWERHGWKGSAGQKYWFWRDRKGLIGNPLSFAANLVFLYGLATFWWLPAAHSLDVRLAAATLVLLLYRTTVRAVCAGRLYGLAFALTVPLRGVCANFINSMASFLAMFRFARAKIRGEPLLWVKTEHKYPSRSTLLAHKRKLGEILTGSGYLTETQLQAALLLKPPDLRLGEYLVTHGLLTEEEMYEALSLQQGLPAGPIDPDDIAPNAARALPRHVVRNWRVLPFRISAGSLHLATPEVPTDEMTRELCGFTNLEVRFQLITTENFERLLELL